jgi:hypothetical protein
VPAATVLGGTFAEGMSFMKWKLLAAVAAIVIAGGLLPPAKADLILTFGQSGSGNTITGTSGLTTGTTISGTNVPVTITQIAAGVSVPISAFLDVTATNISGAQTAGNLIAQNYSGSFSFNGLANNTGTNYLSGTFSDGAITAQASTAIALFADTATFQSDVITTLNLPRSLSLGLTNVTPPVSTIACTAVSCAPSSLTLASFTASVAGNASAETTPVAEPGSLALLTTGLFGLGFVAYRRRKHEPNGIAAA